MIIYLGEKMSSPGVEGGVGQIQKPCILSLSHAFLWYISERVWHKSKQRNILLWKKFINQEEGCYALLPNPPPPTTSYSHPQTQHK